VLSPSDTQHIAFYRAVPRLAAGVRVEHKPILAAGEFVWGDALITAGYPEGVPCSHLVAQIVSRIDGCTPVGDILQQLCAGYDATAGAQIAQSVLTTLQILYVDGAVAAL
jgi:hypothetical protein